MKLPDDVEKGLPSAYTQIIGSAGRAKTCSMVFRPGFQKHWSEVRLARRPIASAK